MAMLTRSVSAKTASVIVVALALASALNYYYTADRRNRAYQDPWMTSMIDIEAERLRGVIEIVPQQAVVGYISDFPLDKGRDAARFGGDRYALAPRLVLPYQRGQRQAWVLGNFSKVVDLTRVERENGVELVKDFGSGVVLFRSE
jgi:hypothetical protein